jgi:hypothetical protein
MHVRPRAQANETSRLGGRSLFNPKLPASEIEQLAASSNAIVEWYPSTCGETRDDACPCDPPWDYPCAPGLSCGNLGDIPCPEFVCGVIE